MENCRGTNRFALEGRREAWGALSAAGLWLGVGFVGASALAAALVHAIGGEATPLSALALALGGGTVAVLAWRYARSILERADAANVDAASARDRGGEPGDRARPTFRHAAAMGGE